MLAREIGVLVVLTDDGPVRASYGARMLGEIARDRSRVAGSRGSGSTLRRWCDGPVTVEDVLTRPPAPDARRRAAAPVAPTVTSRCTA